MKVGSIVLGLHVVAVVAFSLTQGCVTTESQGSGRNAGARTRGPWSHQHKGVDSSGQPVAVANSPAMDSGTNGTSLYDPVILDNDMPEPYVAPAHPVANTETYIVQKGDILSRLAVRFNTTTKTLVSMNNLANPDVLYTGQELRVPAGSHVSATSNHSSSPKSPSVKKGGTYEIQPGDTLSRIAVAAGVSIEDLRSLNNITDDKIFAGDTINIPSGGKVPSKTQKATPKKETPPVAPPVVEPAPLAPAPLTDAAETTGTSGLAVMDHVVYPGETLDDISRQYSVTKSEIMRLNNISDELAIKEGQRLRIPISE